MLMLLVNTILCRLNITLVPANMLRLSFDPYNLFILKSVLAKFYVF